jgi:hypothetical protein
MRSGGGAPEMKMRGEIQKKGKIAEFHGWCVLRNNLVRILHFTQAGSSSMLRVPGRQGGQARGIRGFSLA